MAEQRIILNEFMPYQLANLAQRVSGNLSHTYRTRFNLTIPEWRVIACLGERGRTTAKVIGQSSFMDKVKTSRAIKSLNEKGILSKEQDPHDSRSTWLSLSRKGHKLYNDLIPYALEWERGFMGALKSKERQQLKEIVAKLSAYLHQIE